MKTSKLDRAMNRVSIGIACFVSLGAVAAGVCAMIAPTTLTIWSAVGAAVWSAFCWQMCD